MTRPAHRNITGALILGCMLSLAACSSGGGSGGSDDDSDAGNGGPNPGPTTPTEPALMFSASNDGAISVLAVAADGGLDYLTYETVANEFTWNDVVLLPGDDILLGLAEATLFSFGINVDDGELTVLDSIPVGNGATDVIVNSSGGTAYVANLGDDTISVVNVDGNGLLSDGGTAITGSNAADIRIHPNGNLLYSVNRNDQDVSIFQINGDGSLEERNQAFADTFSVTAIAFSPDGNHAYLTRAENSDNLVHLTVNTVNGVLTSATTISVGNTPTDVKIDSAGAYAYTANANGDNVSVVSLGAGGVPTFEQSHAAGDNTQNIILSPDGDTLYAGAMDDNEIIVFQIGLNGGLTRTERKRMRGRPNGQAVRVGTGNLHVDAERLYMPNPDDSMVYIFPRDTATGALLPASMTTAGTSPINIAFHPNGRFAYVINDGSADVHAFSVDADTGALAGIGVSSLTNLVDDNLVRLAIDPSGRFLYVMDNRQGLGNAGILFLFEVDDDGTLTFVNGANETTDFNPENLVIHPNGRYLYSIDSFGDGITTFEINKFTGELTQRQLFNTGDRPLSGQVHPNGRYLFVTIENDSELARYTIADNNGTLTSEQTYESGSTTETAHLTIHPDGEWILVTETDGAVAIYSVNDNTTPAFDSLLPAPAGVDSADWIRFSPNGEHVYALSGDGIMHFTFDAANGTLSYQSVTAQAGSNNYQASFTLDRFAQQ